MAGGSKQLKQRAKELEGQGADPLRVELLETAHRFKRSWIEMAAGLIKVREQRAYERWDHPEFYAYCQDELLLTRRTVEKLTGSYSTLKRHAPQHLSTERSEPVPSFDAVDYFARVVGEKSDDAPSHEAPREVIADLRQAVFDDAQPVSAIRKQFNPILFTRSDEQNALDLLDKTSSSARRLAKLVPCVDGLSRTRAGEVMRALEALQHDLDGLRPAAAERAGAA